jgi:hypothetical protein
MRCSNCGLPLSPSRTNCPRCGTNYNGVQKNAWSEQDALSPQAGPFAPEKIPASLNVQQGHVESEAAYAQWNAYSAPTFHDSPTSYDGQVPMQAGLETTPVSDKDHASFDLSPTVKKHSMPHPIPQKLEPNQHPTTPPQTISQPSDWSTMPAPLGLFPQAAYNPAPSPRMRRTTRLGFTAAGACLTVGALILTLVSIIAQPLLLASNSSDQTASPINPRNTSLAENRPSPIVATPTPTEIFPGAQFITNARMASAVDKATGQATQYATTFPTNQRIYVTFALNAGLQGGAVCLLWYMNNQYISHYEFPVGKGQLYNSYSYNSMSNPGTGYVEVYWATSVACTDKSLAARVPFTVK